MNAPSTRHAAGIDTRDKLLDAARRLYAERGVFNVSLAEVVRAAGQRNASAIQYHFGSRDHLLLALMEPQAVTLRARRDELLAHAVRSAGTHVVVDALVRPLVELAREGWRSRAWMKIGLELADHRERIAPELEALLHSAGGDEVLALLAERVAPLPPVVWTLRTNIGIGFTARAATERASALDNHRRSRANMLDDDAFVANLIEMFIAALCAPWPIAR